MCGDDAATATAAAAAAGVTADDVALDARLSRRMWLVFFAGVICALFGLKTWDRNYRWTTSLLMNEDSLWANPVSTPCSHQVPENRLFYAFLYPIPNWRKALFDDD